MRLNGKPIRVRTHNTDTTNDEVPQLSISQMTPQTPCSLPAFSYIAVHLLILTKLTIVQAIVIEEFILFPRNLLQIILSSSSHSTLV